MYGIVRPGYGSADNEKIASVAGGLGRSAYPGLVPRVRIWQTNAGSQELKRCSTCLSYNTNFFA